MLELQLIRHSYLPHGTFGTLSLPGSGIVHTVERPWKDNKPFESCIPEGKYPLVMRPSGVVARSTREKYTQGWEVQNVPGRSFIMIHPGNWPSNLEGCIAPGLSLALMKDPKSDCPYGVTSSQAAFEKLMSSLKPGEPYTLVISHMVAKLG